MIHSARPIVTPVANIVFCCFVSKFEKWGRTDNMCENNYPLGQIHSPASSDFRLILKFL